MEDLKEIKKNCYLIAEFNNPAYIGKTCNEIFLYRKKSKCALYGNGRKEYYVYICINKPIIKKYDNYEIATERFNEIVEVLLAR